MKHKFLDLTKMEKILKSEYSANGGRVDIYGIEVCGTHYHEDSDEAQKDWGNRVYKFENFPIIEIEVGKEE